jgi:hypothetical protein
MAKATSNVSKRYLVVDNPFYDGVRLHPVGSVVSWAGPAGQSLEEVDAPVKRRSKTDAPVFPDPLAGRGDGEKVAAAAKPTEPVVMVQ